MIHTYNMMLTLYRLGPVVRQGPNRLVFNSFNALRGEPPGESASTYY